MHTCTATEARNNIGKLWDSLADGPVMVMSAGRPIAVVVAPDEFAALQRASQEGVRPAARPGFARHLFPGIDVDGWLDTPIEETFEGYL